MPNLTAEAIALGRDERLSAILRAICEATGMGFAAVARVTEQRWIACLVEDRIIRRLIPDAMKPTTKRRRPKFGTAARVHRSTPTLHHLL